MQNNQKIPEGWSVKKLGECFSFLKTPSYSRVETTDSGDVHYIHYGDIHTKYPLHVFPKDIDIYVSNDQAQRGDLLKTGDLILLDASEDYEGTTKCIELMDIKDNDKIIAGLHTLALRDNANYFSNGFRAYITSMPFVKINFWKQVSGFKVYGVSKDNLKKLKLLLPPLAEQEKISEILGTWDEAIEKLSDLIEQKKLLKKGLMQKLLTGKIRLPGFAQPWKEVKLGELCKINTGKKDVNEGNPDGLYPFFTCARTNTFSDSFSFDKEAILIAGNGEVGNCQYYVGKFEAYQRTYVLSDFKVIGLLLFQYLSYFFKQYVENQKQQGAMPYIKLKSLTDFCLFMPTNKDEQNKILELLSTADDEINLLNQKLEALKEQKKGLMQQLLTGQIRVKVN